MTTITQTIDSLGDVPLRSNPTNFAERGDAFLGKLPTFRTQLNTVAAQMNTVAEEVSDNADIASAAAITAANSAQSAAAIAGAVAWNAATNYALNAAAISQIDFLTYRRIVAGISATDPKNDTVNWVKLNGTDLTAVETLSNKTLVNPSYTENAKGSQTTGTHTFDYNLGSVGSITIAGALAIAFSNWPASGKEAAFHLWVTNGNAFALTLPLINWVKPDRTTTTSFSTYLTSIGVASLQSAGVNQFVIWTKDNGVTLYGKLV